MNLQEFSGLYQEKLFWEGSFEEYLDKVRKNPYLTRSAFQRIYDMIVSYGKEEYTVAREKVVHYNFFDDPFEDGKDAIFGLDKALMNLIDVLKSASQHYGQERRILLLHGPVGSSKSTIVRLLKKGLEDYSKTDKGALYAPFWYVQEDDKEGLDILGIIGEFQRNRLDCPMHEEPLRLIPKEIRPEILQTVSPDKEIIVEGDACPLCRFIMQRFLKRYKGDWRKVLSNHVKVYRLILSEIDRVGIGTFQPKDEKNQDSTELSGDINYRKLAEYGSESDPRAFDFDGEFEVANRGLLEFVEVLKLDTAFLYDLLGASQEHKIKPKRFAQVDIDECIIGHTNEPEYEKLKSDEFMEALRDRTTKVDIPYVTKLADEIKIYQRDFNEEKHIQHIAPHTLELASMWAILTRLEEPKKHDLSLLEKMKLYNGRDLPGFTADVIRELKKETEHEAMEGISPRYIQDKISNALVSDESKGCLSPFLVLRELEKGLEHHSLITSNTQKENYKKLLTIAREEFEEIAKTEVQKAIAADEGALQKLCDNYIDNVEAYVMGEKIKDPITGEDIDPDERLMRSIEEKIDIPESQKDDFRNSMMSHIASIARKNKEFSYQSNERLNKALELKLFEDRKDSVKLSQLVSRVVDPETQEKIDVVKQRLINQYGYCDICATEILNFVASIFARGERSEPEESPF